MNKNGGNLQIVQNTPDGVYQGGVPKPAGHLFSSICKVQSLKATKNKAKACIPKCIFLHPKPPDLNFKRPKPANQIILKSKPAFLTDVKRYPETYISIHVPYTSTANILFIIH